MFSLWFLYYGKLLDRRYSRKMTLLTTAGLFLMIDVIGLLLELMDVWKLLCAVVSVGLLLLYVIFFFEGPLYWKVLLVVGQNLVTGIGEIATLAIVFPLGHSASVQAFSVSGFIFSFLIDFLIQAILLGMIGVLVKRHTNCLDLGGMKRFAVYPLAQFVLLNAMVWAMAPGGDTAIIVAMVVFLAVALLADIALFSAIRDIDKKRTIAIRNRYLTEQCRLQMEHYTALQKQYADIRKLRHDIVGHLHTIQILTERGEGEKAQAYADDVLHEYRRISAGTDCKSKSE